MKRVRTLPRIVAQLLPLGIAAACSATGSLPDYLGPESEVFTGSARIYFDKGKDETNEIDLYEDGSVAAAVDLLAIQWPFLVRESTLSATIDKNTEAQIGRLNQLSKARLQAEAQERKLRETVVQARAKALDVDANPGATQDERDQAHGAGNRAESELLRAQDGVALAEIREREQTIKVDQMQAETQRANKIRLDGDWLIGPRLSIGIASPSVSSDDGVGKSNGAPVLFLGGGVYMDLFKGDRKPNSSDGVGARIETGYVWGVTADESIGDNDDSAWFVGLSLLFN